MPAFTSDWVGSRPLARIVVCAALAVAGLLTADPPASAEELSASWQLGSNATGADTTSTVMVSSSSAVDVATFRFDLPAGSNCPLSVSSARGLGPGVLQESGSAVSYRLDQDVIVPAGESVGLVLSGWHNPDSAGYQQLTGVALVPQSGSSPGAATSNSELITGSITVSLSAGYDGSNAQLTWSLQLPPAPRYGEVVVDVPAELAGPPESTTVTGLASGAVTRTSTGLDYLASPAQPAPSRRTVTISATWSQRPAAVRDIPLAVSAGDGSGTTWAIGSTRTPVELEPGSCGEFRSDGWVHTENALPGDSNWPIASVAARAPTGWAGAVSAQCGDTVDLHVSSPEAYRVLAYRMGWYDDAGARLVFESDERPAVSQPAPVIGAANMVETPWTITDSLSIGTGWVPGDYLLKLVGADGNASFIPLTIRDDGSHAAILVEDSVLTWQAYNHYAGYSLYTGPDGQSADRSRIASFDRPYAGTNGSDYGDGRFLTDDYSFVRFAEKRSMDVTYWTDLDLDAHPDLLAQHKTLVLLRHSEYWTQRMRDAVTSARDGGTNLAFLGANNMYWRARLEPDASGANRHVVVYRDENEDPEPTAADATTTYRSAPINNPEQRVIGVQYDCLQVDAPMLVTDAEPWVFANTGLTVGSQLPDLVFQEFDRYFTGIAGPQVELLAHSPLACPAHNESQTYSDMSYYNAPSGAGVFAVGTMGWEQALDDWDTSRPYSASERALVQQITQNVLTVFAQGPAGDTHPAVPNSA